MVVCLQSFLHKGWIYFAVEGAEFQLVLVKNRRQGPPFIDRARSIPSSCPPVALREVAHIPPEK